VVATSTNLKADQEGKMEKETLDEKLPGLFEPDTLLPIQYFEAMRRKHLLEGEKRLILSVLEDAVECFMKCIDSSTNKGQRLFRDGRRVDSFSRTSAGCSRSITFATCSTSTPSTCATGYGDGRKRRSPPLRAALRSAHRRRHLPKRRRCCRRPSRPVVVEQTGAGHGAEAGRAAGRDRAPQDAAGSCIALARQASQGARIAHQ